MKNFRTPIHATTVSVDMSVRDWINQEAVRLGLSQRQMVGRLVEAYAIYQNKDATGTFSPVETQDLRDALEKILRRDDRIVAFIKEQEKLFLKPILASTQIAERQIPLLVELLKQLQ